MLRDIMAKVLEKAARPNLAGLVFCCAPVLVFLALLILLGLNPFHWVPLWNDEVQWYFQIDAVAKHGIPLGYAGCNETHAAVGTFGFWGGAAIYAMSLFAKLFGWHYWSPPFMNVFHLTLANIAFFFLAKPSMASSLRLCALNCVLFVNALYIFAGMSECTRFSMAIILAGLFLYILNDENRANRFYRHVLYAATPVCLLFFINCYIMFSFLLPVYGYALVKHHGAGKHRHLQYAAMCGLMPLAVSALCLFLLQKTSALYPNTLQGYFSQPSMILALKSFCATIAENARCAGFHFILKSVKTDYGFVSSYLLFYYIVLAASILNLIVKLARRNVHAVDFLLPYAMSVFVAGFLALYSTTSSWTYIRGLNVALVFAMYLIAVEWRKAAPLLICLAFMQFLPFVPLLHNSISIRLQKSSWYGGGYEMFEKYAAVFAENMRVSETDDAWDNTYALYGKIYNFYSMIPSGISPNFIFNRRTVTKPRYAIAGTGVKLSLPGYRKIYSDDLIEIFEKDPSSSEPAQQETSK